VSHPDFFARQQPAGEGGPGIQPGCGLLLATGSTPPNLPLQRGGMISVKAQESPAIFPTGEKPTNLFSSEPFRKLRAPIYPLDQGKSLYFRGGWRCQEEVAVRRCSYKRAVL